MKLLEGKYDQISGILVDAIWLVIKKSKEIYDETGNELYATQTQKTPDFKFQIIIRREEDFGAYKLDANTYHGKIVISLELDPDIEPDYYSELNSELQEITRHEIEHLLQEKKVPGKAKFPSAYMLKKINKDDYEYLIADHETEAMVKGFYRKAKTQKEKLDVVMDDFLSYFIKDDRITKKQAKEIKDKWLKYAKKHLPAALYKKINEVQNFQRGLDPKEAMGTGIVAKPIYINAVSYQYVSKPNASMTLRQRIPSSMCHIIFRELKHGRRNTYEKYGNPLAFDYFGSDSPDSNTERIYYLTELEGKYISFEGTLYKISDEILEAQHFQRGLEPKTAMGIGMLRYLKPALLGNDPDGYEEIGEWLKKNPTLAKELEFDFSNPKEYENIVGIEVDYYCEEINPDVEPEDLEKEFQKVKTIKTGDGEVNVVIGKLVDGSKVLFYFGGLISGYAARKEWLGINESYNFERGLDPKVAMNTGDVVERARKDIKAAITKLAEKYSSYKPDQIQENEKDAFIIYEFLKTYGLETWKFYIGYRKIEDSHSKTWFAGWSKVNETWLNKTPVLGQPNMGMDLRLDDLAECVQKLDQKLKESINESQNFTRGLDPKDAMSTGNVINRQFRKNCERVKAAIISLAKESDHENDVYEEHPEDGTSLFYTAGFNMTKTLTYSVHYSMWVTGDPPHVTNNQYCAQFYTPNNPNGEDNTGSDYCYPNLLFAAISQLRIWIQNGLGTEYDYVSEAQNFTRGLEPKEAMGIGDKYEQVKVKIKEVILKLANSFNGYGEKDVTSEDSIKYQFYKQYGKEEWVFYIMNELDENFDEWACGWYRNWSGGESNKTQKLGGPGIEDQLYFINFEDCVNAITKELNDCEPPIFRKVVESLNFERGLEPKKAMGIGLKSQIKKWLNDNEITNYTINSDLTIDVDGNVDFRFSKNDPRQYFSKFPDYIQFNHVKGFFTVVGAGMTTLRGCPKIVDRQFCCNENQLKTLDFCPKEVRLHFICYDNPKFFSDTYVRKRCKVTGYVETVKDEHK